jgi:hypothetical protein
MKKIGEYTARGKIETRTTKRITLFDGRFDTGYRIISFQVLPSDPDDAAADVVGVLATEEGAATVAWDLSDQRQIAWAGNKNDGYSSTAMNVVDPDNFIIEDLYFHGKNAATTHLNYIITMEKYDTTDWMGALTMVRNSAQDV